MRRNETRNERNKGTSARLYACGFVVVSTHTHTHSSKKHGDGGEWANKENVTVLIF